MEEWVVQSFDPRCPYCDAPIVYDPSALRPGDNAVQCPACQKTFIKMLPVLFQKGKGR